MVKFLEKQVGIKSSDDGDVRTDKLCQALSGLGITDNQSTILTLDAPALTIHSQTFRELLKSVKKEDMEKVTEKTASIIHSIIQDKKKASLDKIRDIEVLAFISEVYETTNLVKELHYRLEGKNVVMCLSGENLHSQTYTQFIRSEVVNVMKPWFKLKEYSETPGSLILTFEPNGQNYALNPKFTML